MTIHRRSFTCIALVTVLTWIGLSSRASGAETTLVDSEGKTAWLYTPTEKPDPNKTYWLVVGVHGVGANGKGACGADVFAKEFDDVIVLGPTFGGTPRPATAPATQAGTTQPATRQPGATQPTSRPTGMMRGSYQMSGPTHEAKVAALVAEVGKTWKLHPKIIVHGFSAGAQFVHRYAMHHPDLVAGVSAHSAGSWAKPDGNDKINLAAKEIPFAVSCGEADGGRGGPAGTPTRIEGAKLFVSQLQALGFSVEFKTWPGIGHQLTPGAMEMAKNLVEKVRSTTPMP